MSPLIRRLLLIVSLQTYKRLRHQKPSRATSSATVNELFDEFLFKDATLVFCGHRYRLITPCILDQYTVCKVANELIVILFIHNHVIQVDCLVWIGLEVLFEESCRDFESVLVSL